MNVEKFAFFILTDNIGKKIYRERQLDKSFQVKCKQWLKDGICINHDSFIQLCKNILRVTNVPKYRSFQYRLLHRAVITNIHLKHWKMRQDDSCSFCGKHRETYKHLFCECEIIIPIWSKAKQIMFETTNLDQVQDSPDKVLLNTIHDKPAHILNFICLVFKQYIYSSRCRQIQPNCAEFVHLVKKIRNMEKYIAIKNGKIVKYNLKWNCNKVNDPDTCLVNDIQNIIDEYVENM